MAEIVETIVADSMAELRTRRDARTAADWLELRLDGVRDVDVAGALAGRRLPVIVTCRAAWEGGRFDGSEEERLAILARAAEAGAEFVDVEWKSFAAFARGRSTSRLIVSHHDFAGVPVDLAERVSAMRATGAEVVKVAVTAHTLTDCLTLKDAVVADRGEHVAIAMGNPGRLTRLFPAWLGSRWTYGGRAAPGQVSTDALATRYRVRETTPSTQVFAVTGAPLGHSASPAMHNAAFVSAGLDAVYVPLESADAADFLAFAEAVPLAGASVTIPLKRDLLTSDVRVDELPRRIGALNTLKRGEHGWEGRNFDVAGFLAPLEQRRVNLRGERAVVLGAGGAARAAVEGLRGCGADVEISARRFDAARALAAEFGVRAVDGPPAGGWRLLVNTTPVGMWPQVDASPLPAASLAASRSGIVYDMVYNPATTRLLRDAATAGMETIGGLEMLVGQAARQFEWWTGRPAPRDVMFQAATSFIETL